MESLELVFYDSNPDHNLALSLLDCSPFGAPCSGVAFVVSIGSGGTGTITDPGLNHPVSNTANTLLLESTFGGVTDGSLAIMGAVVGYRLQVSPAPAVASFGDVPTNHPYFQFIEALAAAGITAGCQAAPPLYCPDRQLTRGEMAVYLAKALGLHFPN